MKLPKKLRSLVKQSVALLGELLQRELGTAGFQQIEHIRSAMSKTHKLSKAETLSRLKNYYKKLKILKPQEQHNIARAFTLMLELINACENAYRSHRINSESPLNPNFKKLPDAIIYVLTAHPTEARSPQNIAIFYDIQNTLVDILNRTKSCIKTKCEVNFTLQESNTLLHSLEIAWRTSIVQNRTPKVKDEAEHVYSLIFRDEILFSLLEKRDDSVPFYVRSWVGADKDGHPGVNEKTLLQSLTLSRKKLLQLVCHELAQIRKTLKLFSSAMLQKKLSHLEKIITGLRTLKTNDAKSVRAFAVSLASFAINYEENIGASHPCLNRIKQIIHVFPALVVPLELRESSDVLMSSSNQKKLPIYRMLKLIEKISRGGNPRFYVRGFIISMTKSIEHLLKAANFQKSIFKNIPLPIIPLFEELRTLAISNKIISEYVKNDELKNAAIKCWDRQIEIMVGYSDSAKESGVLASRLAISDALPKLEKICKRAGFIPIFFHGLGGSIDRGGGSIEDQTAWWPKSSLRFYKVTVQGEMIERSLAAASIAKRQIDKIIENSARGLTKTFNYQKNLAVESFAKAASEKYRTDIDSPEFLNLIEFATPYSFLNILKIGSRPTIRTLQPTVKSLRAIPWVMCWTQTRVLFPIWWGIGTSWKNSSHAQKAELKKAFRKDPIFTSYIKALGFTLAKIELNIWKIYLEHSGLSKSQIETAAKKFQTEFKLTLKCYIAICKQKNLLWFRPWLGESINLRSPMIHPLNLLQIIAKENKNPQLLRITTAGISSGMLTTG